MPDSDPLAPGNAAPPGSADVAFAAPSGATAVRKRNPIARVVLGAAAGTSVNPLDRENYAVATNRGYGDAMGRGFELALTLAVMTGIGWLVDRWLGTAPVFTMVLSIVGFVGISVKLWIGYDLEMRKHETGAIWNRGKAGSTSDQDAGAA
ncbi:MAG: hypothetical protein JWM47_1199 [Acidimicrobiales bacterium]|nr:hypothetical protein [Acidimicrobiales bacterium]